MATRPQNQIVQRPQQSQVANDFDDRGRKFTQFINGNAIKNLLAQSLGGPQAAAQVTSTLISQVSANQNLQKCQPMTILAAALRGEVGMGLSLVLGDYAIIPYGDQASFQLQINGLKRLCMNSGAYSKIDVFDVREGEFKGRDGVTREPIIEWIEDDDLREQLPIVGYYAFYRLNGSYNGFTSTLYWTHEKILRHAARYSKAFNREKYDALLSGKITGWDAEKLRRGSPWYGEPTDEAHMKMCKKTVLKQLLGDGFAPKSTVLSTALSADNAEEQSDEPVVYADEFDRMAREAALDVVKEPAQIEEPAPAPAPVVTEPVEKRGPGRPKKAEPKPAEPMMPDFPDMSDDDPFA